MEPMRLPDGGSPDVPSNEELAQRANQPRNAISGDEVGLLDPVCKMSNATLFANAGCFRKIKCKHGNAMCKCQRKLVRGTSWRARAWGQHVSFQKHPLKTWIRLLSADGECRLCD